MKIKKRHILFCIIVIGLLIPQKYVVPVKGASQNDYNKDTFWYYPWGTSITHKGVDVFAKDGTDVISAVSGLVLYSGQISKGGNVIVILGPKWRLHYYAHLGEFKTSTFSWAIREELIGSVGTTGNAKGKQPHLHYAIITLIPYFWRVDSSHQGWKKMFYLNPIDYFTF